jgi:hypothetical protein
VKSKNNKTFVLPESEQVLSDMISERRPPANEYEKKLLKQIRELKAQGKVIDIPSNGIY